jgi:hypothetical protein
MVAELAAVATMSERGTAVGLVACREKENVVAGNVMAELVSAEEAPETGTPEAALLGSGAETEAARGALLPTAEVEAEAAAAGGAWRSW